MLRVIVSQFTKEICPYCFEYFRVKDTPFRCGSHVSKCAPEPDPVYKSHWNETRPMGKVIHRPPTFLDRFKYSARCHDCDEITRKRICPNCHTELPHTTGKAKNYVFAVIGAKDSGKSHYIAVLIDQIKKRVGPNMNLLLQAENDFTIDRYANDFYRHVYKNRTVIPTTISGISDKQVSRPMAYSIRITNDGWFQRNKIKKYISLVFFDTAGEDLNSEDTMSTVNKYIYRSDGIVLLVDPLQLTAVRDKLDESTPKPDLWTEVNDILSRATRLIEKGRNLSPSAKINTPIAIAFSKFDAVLPLINKQYQLNSSARHDEGFDRSDFDAINGEMTSLLNSWGGQEIIQIARTRYAKYGFFGLSALGCNPHKTHKIPNVQPNRVEDPFLWILASNGIIKDKRRG